MKSKIYTLIKLVSFLLILFVCISIIYNVTKNKYSYQKMEDFFNQKEDFDVLFFGSSHVVNGIIPMELWKDYGLVTYNLGNHMEYMPLTYYNMLLALEETKPKLVVIDTFLVYNNEKIYNSMMPHKTLDAYPLSYKKYLAVADLYDKKDLLNREIQYLFNFSIYHTRWKELTKNDFNNVNSYQKGAETGIAIRSGKKAKDFNSISVYDEQETIGMIYLRKVIEYCQKNEIEVLLTYLPAIENEMNVSISKYVKSISKEYNVNYINFLNIELIDNNIDFFDEWAHLNPSGARKITNYLGKYIADNYNIKSKKDDIKYSFWECDYNEYIDFKIKNLNNNTGNLYNILMLLYNEKDIKYDIEISSKREIEKDNTLKYLLRNLNNSYVIKDEIFEQNKDKTIRINLYDVRNNNLIKTIWF